MGGRGLGKVAHSGAMSGLRARKEGGAELASSMLDERRTGQRGAAVAIETFLLRLHFPCC